MTSFSLLTSSFSLHLVQVLAHFLWQGFLIALGAAGASWLLRRQSAHRRYLLNLGALGLMVLCLPATSMLLEHYDDPKTPVSPSPTPAAESVPSKNANEPRLIVPDTPMGPFSTESAPQTTPPSMGNGPETPADVSAWSWQSLAPYVTSVYLLGVAVMLVRLVLGLAAGYRMRRHLRPVVDAQLLELVSRQARALGLRFVPAVCYCERIAVPALVGVLRPMVLLPISLASNLAPQEIEAILTHELAHLRRYDPLVNLLQRIVEAMLFFHPAVWYVSRRIGLEREHCCDDLVVAAGKQPLAYAQSLVRIAELSLNATQPRLTRWASLLRSSGDRPSQLRGRILRLLGDVEDSRVRLTRTGALTFVAVVVVGVAIALGAIRATAATDDGAQTADTKGETITTVDRKSSEVVKTVSGQVVDEQGQPIAGAKLWLRVGYKVEALGLQGKSRFLLEGESDAQGRFRLAVPEAWFADIDSTGNRGATLWGWAEGYQLESEPSSWPGRGILLQDDNVAEIKLVLGPAADTTLVVMDPDRRPLEGITVAPQCYKFVQGPIGFALPQEAMVFLSAKTDAQGRVRLHGITKRRLTGVSATTEQFGEQLLAVPRKADSNESTLVLEHVGRIEGRLTADDPGLVRGIRIDITTSPRSKTGGLPEGRAFAVSDADGRFVIPAIAEGVARFMVRLDEHSPVLPVCPQKVEIRVGDTTQVEIPLRRGIPISGVLRVKESLVPVAGARLHLFSQGPNVWADATTDTEGRYTALLLPGIVKTGITSLPKPYVRQDYVSADVPTDAKEYTLPPLEVVPAQPLQGRLIDRNDQPVADISLSIKSKRPQSDVHASGTSDKDGRFVLEGVPEGEKLEDLAFDTWCISEESIAGCSEGAKLVTTEPLVLRVENVPGCERKRNWPFQVPEAIERGMMMDRVRLRAKPR